MGKIIKNLGLTEFKIFKVLENKNYLIISLVSALIMLVLFPVIQALVTGGLQNLDLWFSLIPKINLFLLVIFSLFFGLLLALQIYNFRVKTCSLSKKNISASSGGIGAFIAVLIPACPACASLAVLLLPAATAISFGQFLVKYNTLLLLISISLLILGVFLLGGFKKE